MKVLTKLVCLMIVLKASGVLAYSRCTGYGSEGIDPRSCDGSWTKKSDAEYFGDKIGAVKESVNTTDAALIEYYSGLSSDNIREQISWMHGQIRMSRAVIRGEKKFGWELELSKLKLLEIKYNRHLKLATRVLRLRNEKM